MNNTKVEQKHNIVDEEEENRGRRRMHIGLLVQELQLRNYKRRQTIIRDEYYDYFEIYQQNCAKSTSD